MKLTFNSADGFFDAGMLLQALKARNATDTIAAVGGANSDLTVPATGHARRRGDIGKKLRLVEY